MALFSEEQNEMIKFLNGGIAPQGGWKYDAEKDLIDVWGDFYCADQGLKDFKGVKFGNIDGHFNCSNNELTSLEGAPRSVEGLFNCANNKLTSLEGAPRKVDNFNCSGNLLTTLEGGPDRVSIGKYKCSKNNLTSLKGLPTGKGSGSLKIDCSSNKLRSLETVGDPEKISEFICRKNEIISLDGAPLIKGYRGVEAYQFSYQGNKGISGKTLELIHFTMSSNNVSYLEALGMLKTQIKAVDLKKLMSGYENGDSVLKGASLLGRFS
jgi:Leucine-rich repeat (LRR) protein